MNPNPSVGLFSSDFAWKKPFQKTAEESWGGVGETVYHLAMELNERNYEVHVFTSSRGSYEKSEYQNIIVHEYSEGIAIGDSTASIEILYRHLMQDLDLIHIHRGLPSAAIAGYVHAVFRGSPLVLTVHGDLHYYENRIRNGLLAIFDVFSHRMLNKADRITTVSQEFCRTSSYLENHRHRTNIVPNGINLPDTSNKNRDKSIHSNDGSKSVLYLGKMEPRKNPTTIINAIPGIIKSFSETKFIFIGTGERAAIASNLANELGVSDYVEFTGFISEEKKRRFLQSADVFCLPSNNESFGLAALEAAAHSLPLVLGDIPCFRDLFSDAAIFVDPENDSEISNAVSSVLGDRALQQKLGDSARRKAEQYSWYSVVDEYESIYKSLIG